MPLDLCSNSKSSNSSKWVYCHLLCKHKLIYYVQKTCTVCSRNANWHGNIWGSLAGAWVRRVPPSGPSREGQEIQLSTAVSQNITFRYIKGLNWPRWEFIPITTREICSLYKSIIKSLYWTFFQSAKDNITSKYCRNSLAMHTPSLSSARSD